MVSIITPTYNCGRFIAEAIRSAQAQTYKDWEMIIVDDCSTDNTQKVVHQFVKSDPRIKYIRNKRNAGAAMARNHALREAKGKYIAFLDSDDVWLPEKLERQIAFMEKNGYAFTYHEYDEISESDEFLGVHLSGLRRVSKFQMYSCCWPGCLTVMYDAEKIGLIQIENIRRDNDSALWLKIVKKAPCYLLPETLAQYRRRSGSITTNGIATKILWHYRLFHNVEHMNCVAAWFWTCMNICGNSYKKLLYKTTAYTDSEDDK